MDVIIFIVSWTGYLISDIDFITLHFYIPLAFALWKSWRHYTNDKAAKR